MAKDADTGEKETSEEKEEDATTTARQDEPKYEVREDGEATEQEPQSVQKEDESAASDPTNKPDESMEADNTEPLTVTETIEMKAEAPDTQEAVGAEEAPATDTHANDMQKEVDKQTQDEDKVKAKELIGENAKEESIAESEEKQRMEGKNEGQEIKEEQTDLNEGEKEKSVKEDIENMEENKPESNVNEDVAEVAGTNLNPDEEEKVSSDKNEKEAEEMEENKPEGGENIAEVRAVDCTQTGDDADKTSSEKDVTEKPTEELEKTEQDAGQKGDASEEKSNEEKKAVEDEGEVQRTQSESQNNPDEHVEKGAGELENPESTLEKEERQETSADQLEESAKLLEESVKSDYVAAGEMPKDSENNALEAEESAKENKDMSKETGVNEVDAENGEVSVAAAPKQTLQKPESENKTDEPHSLNNVGENGKLDSNEPEKELNQKNGNNGHAVNDVASIHSTKEEVKLISKDLDATENNNNMENTQSEAEKHTEVEAVDAFVEGENGDTEEASKASEEGASVLLKPQVQSSLSEHINELEPKGSPEGLTTADSADLVTNWVTMHQTSKYFETFVEPLEEIREVSSEASNEPSSELPRSESPVKMARGGEKENILAIKDESSDVGSNPSEAKKEGSIKDVVQAEESLILHVPIVENEESIKEPATEESERSKENQTDQTVDEGKGADSLVQLTSNVTRTSITSSHLSVTSGKQTVSEVLNEEKASDHGQDVTKTEERKTELLETLSVLDTTKNTNSEDAQESRESKDGTATTEFTVSKLNSMSRQESTREGSLSGDKRELTEDSSHTVSKEHLSSFTADNTLFGQNAYPLLTTSKAENGH